MEPFRPYGSVPRATVPSVNSFTLPDTLPAVLLANPGAWVTGASGLGHTDGAVERHRRRVASRCPVRRSLDRPSYHAGAGAPLRAYARVFSESIPSHARAIGRLIRVVRDPICRHPNKLGIRGLHADRPDLRGPRRRAAPPGCLHANVGLA